MKQNYFFGLVLFGILIMITCDNSKPDEQLNWSNSRLLEIPYKVRFQQYQRGNIVANHSFEERRLIKLDSLNYTYNIAYWKKESNLVRYIDLIEDSLTPPSEISDGYGAIKISKEKYDELKTLSDGITSDFIKVIPGMYDFYFDIRCQDVIPYKERINKYLDDAVDVRILFYDKNKLLINPKSFNPISQKKTDITFKGLSFSHFEKIDSSGWMTVKGVTGYYPYNESIIPDDAKFIKVYFGLKSEGTIWLDNIRFYYSKENLTPRERTSIYFDTISNPLDLIIPKPKFTFFYDSIEYFNPDSGKYLEPFIHLPFDLSENQDNIRELKETLLHNFEKSKYRYDIREIKSGYQIPDKYLKDGLIISVGKSNLFKKYQSQLPLNEIENKHEGYFIHCIHDTINVIFIYGNDERSLCYAVQTAMHLFNDFKYISCKIIDFPSTDMRSVIISQELLSQDLKGIISKYRLNGIFKPGVPFHDQNLEIYPVVSSNDFYIPGNKSDKVILNGDQVLNKSDLGKVIKTSKKHNTQLESLLRSGLEVYFISPFSTNQRIKNEPVVCQLYMNGIHTNNNLHFLSYGEQKQSQYFDDIQRLYYIQNTGVNPLIVDNFQDAKSPEVKMNAYFSFYPEKIPMGNIFDPFDPMNTSFKTSERLLYIKSTDILTMFRLATFGEYLWDPDNYNPDLSLFKVMVKEFGIETAKYLYYFNDAYCGLFSTIQKMKSEGNSARIMRSSENEIAMLNKSLEEIIKRIPERKEIIDFLYVLKRSLIEMYNSQHEKALVDKKMKEDTSFSSIFTGNE